MSGFRSTPKPACWILIFLSPFLISALATAQLGLSVSNVTFGNVQIGSSSIKLAAVTNTGKSTVTISQDVVSGGGFSFVGPGLPITLGPQQSTNLSVGFAPKAAGSVTGSLGISYSASWGGHNTSHSGMATVSLSGTGYSATAQTTPGYLVAPSSMNLGSVTMGSSKSQALTLSNSGGSSLIISGATVTGNVFTVSGLSFPYTLAAGSSASLSVTFAPTVSGTSTATLAVSSNASDPSVAVSLSGTASTTSSGSLGVTPGSMSFGTVNIGSTQTQNGSVTASGGSVTLSSASSSNSAFSLGGLTLPVTLAAGQSVPFTITFAPTASGSASANISFFASNSTSAAETASGSGAAVQHTVNLSWNASTSTSISGYNVYRGSSSTGPFSRLNPALDPSMNYSDSTVQSGQTYYYVTTAVDSSGMESGYSNKVTAAVPMP